MKAMAKFALVMLLGVVVYATALPVASESVSAEEEVESQRLVLMDRVKDRKTIEELRLRDFDQYLLELRRFEQSVIDDLATLRGVAGLEGALEGTA